MRVIKEGIKQQFTCAKCETIVELHQGDIREDMNPFRSACFWRCPMCGLANEIGMKSKQPAPAKKQETKPTSPAVLFLPLNDGSSYPITQEQVDKWTELYGKVDVMSELKKMIGWLDADPKRRKTSAGILRFAAGWLGRQQDSARETRAEKPKQNFEGIKYDDKFLDSLDTDPTKFMSNLMGGHV